MCSRAVTEVDSRPNPQSVSTERNELKINSIRPEQKTHEKSKKPRPRLVSGHLGSCLIFYDGPNRAAHTVRAKPCAEVVRISRATHGCRCMSQKMMTSPLRSRRGPFG